MMSISMMLLLNVMMLLLMVLINKFINSFLTLSFKKIKYRPFPYPSADLIISLQKFDSLQKTEKKKY